MKEEWPALSGAELDVLKALWDRGPATVRQISDELAHRGRSWAYTTVLTLLQRLANKGYATIDSSTHAHVYCPSTSRDELVGIQLQNVADQLCDGMAAPLVLNLIEGRDFTPEDIARFRRLIDKLDQGRSPNSKRAKAGKAQEKSSI